MDSSDSATHPLAVRDCFHFAVPVKYTDSSNKSFLLYSLTDNGEKGAIFANSPGRVEYMREFFIACAYFFLGLDKTDPGHHKSSNVIERVIDLDEVMSLPIMWSIQAKKSLASRASAFRATILDDDGRSSFFVLPTENSNFSNLETDLAKIQHDNPLTVCFPFKDGEKYVWSNDPASLPSCKTFSPLMVFVYYQDDKSSKHVNKIILNSFIHEFSFIIQNKHESNAPFPLYIKEAKALAEHYVPSLLEIETLSTRQVWEITAEGLLAKPEMAS